MAWKCKSETCTCPFCKCQQSHLSPSSFANSLLSLWINSRVVSVDGPSAGGSSLDWLHGCGVQGLLLGHRPLLIAAALRALHLPLPLRLVHIVNPEQQTVVHDLKTFQHLSKGHIQTGLSVQWLTDTWCINLGESFYPECITVSVPEGMRTVTLVLMQYRMNWAIHSDAQACTH